MNSKPDSNPKDLRVELRLSGIVQGVGFRAWTCGRAERFGLTGFARNNDDYSVTVVAEGPQELVRQLAGELADGQGPGRVDEVERVELEASGEFSGFVGR